MSCLKSGGSVARIACILSLVRRFSVPKVEEVSHETFVLEACCAKFGRSLWGVLFAFPGVAESIAKLRREYS